MREIKLFEPQDQREAIQGWILRTTRRRLIHEHEARRLDRLRLSLGLTCACLAAVTGTSAFAAWQSDDGNRALGVTTVVVGIAAALLASALTFLDPGGRAEAHRQAAVAYKKVLRDFEEECGARGNGAQPMSDDDMHRLKQQLGEADLAAPVVPLQAGASFEQKPFRIVRTAEELTDGVAQTPNGSSPAMTASPDGADVSNRNG